LTRIHVFIFLKWPMHRPMAEAEAKNLSAGHPNLKIDVEENSQKASTFQDFIISQGENNQDQMLHLKQVNQ
jgi:hypothetical protein